MLLCDEEKRKVKKAVAVQLLSVELWVVRRAAGRSVNLCAAAMTEREIKMFTVWTFKMAFQLCVLYFFLYPHLNPNRKTEFASKFFSQE